MIENNEFQWMRRPWPILGHYTIICLKGINKTEVSNPQQPAVKFMTYVHTPKITHYYRQKGIPLTVTLPMRSAKSP